jgi:hypothetical protein
MLSADLRSLAGWASGKQTLDDVHRGLLVQRLEAAADRAAAIEAAIIPAQGRGFLGADPKVVPIGAARTGKAPRP